MWWKPTKRGSPSTYGASPAASSRAADPSVDAQHLCPDPGSRQADPQAAAARSRYARVSRSLRTLRRGLGCVEVVLPLDAQRMSVGLGATASGLGPAGSCRGGTAPPVRGCAGRDRRRIRIRLPDARRRRRRSSDRTIPCLPTTPRRARRRRPRRGGHAGPLAPARARRPRGRSACSRRRCGHDGRVSRRVRAEVS